MQRNARLPRLDGSWEKAGRNPAIASLILVLVLGSLYFMAGNLASVAVMATRALGSAARGEAGGILGALGGASAGADFFESMRKNLAANRVWMLALTAVCEFLFFLFAGFALARKWLSSDIGAYAGYKRVPPLGILAGIAGAFAILPVVDAISCAVDALFPAFNKLNEVTAVLYRWDSPPEAVFLFFCIAATPAICEEAIFRGVFQRSLQRRLAFPWSFICSGIVFAFFHQSPLATPALIPVGVLIGFLYWAFDSIWPGMALHAVYNGTILLLTNNALPLPAPLTSGNYLSWPVWVAGAMGIAILCYFVGKNALARKGKDAMDGGFIDAAPGAEASAQG